MALHIGDKVLFEAVVVDCHDLNNIVLKVGSRHYTAAQAEIDAARYSAPIPPPAARKRPAPVPKRGKK